MKSNAQRLNNEANTAPVMAVVGSDTLAEGMTADSVKAKGTRPSLIASSVKALNDRVAGKLTALQTVRQRLAEASDLYNEGEGKAKEATEIANEGALGLYQARTNGLVSAEEASSLLGDLFGFKAKKDGSPGKTPDGQGEAIRKRVVRAVQASEHLAGRDGGSFFEGFTPDTETKDGTTFEDTVARLNEGHISIWRAYDAFAEMKANIGVKVDTDFNPSAIAKIVEQLSAVNNAAAIWAANPALVTAYAALSEAIAVVDQAAAMIEPEVTDEVE